MPNGALRFTRFAEARPHPERELDAHIAPLRHPLLLVKELATVDLRSGGRLVGQPTVSWHRAEYDALGVPWEKRGELLDDHLAAWKLLWRDTPASFDGRHYRF